MRQRTTKTTKAGGAESPRGTTTTPGRARPATDTTTPSSEGRRRVRPGPRSLAVSCLLVPAAWVVAGCGAGTPELDTRTFTIEHVLPHEAQSLLEPYVYGDRPDAPGMMSVTEGALTVRETPDNLDKIERVLAEYDQPRQRDVWLRFQLIEANGTTATDPAIEAVTEQLRRLFRFDGYRLVGEAAVLAGDGGETAQAFPGGEWFIRVNRVYATGTRSFRLDGLALEPVEGFPPLGLEASGVNIRVGQTLVIGSASTRDEGSAMILTVTAEATDTTSIER